MHLFMPLYRFFRCGQMVNDCSFHVLSRTLHSFLGWCCCWLISHFMWGPVKNKYGKRNSSPTHKASSRCTVISTNTHSHTQSGKQQLSCLENLKLACLSCFFAALKIVLSALSLSPPSNAVYLYLPVFLYTFIALRVHFAMEIDSNKPSPRRRAIIVYVECCCWCAAFRCFGPRQQCPPTHTHTRHHFSIRIFLINAFDAVTLRTNARERRNQRKKNIIFCCWGYLFILEMALHIFGVLAVLCSFYCR